MLLTFILIIISIPSPSQSFIPHLKPSFSANPSHHSLPERRGRADKGRGRREEWKDEVRKVGTYVCAYSVGSGAL